MGWCSLDLMPGHEDDVNMVLRSAWSTAYGDSALGFRSVVFRGRGARGESTLYFTPAAHELAEALGAQPCKQPERVGLEVAVGDSRAWAIWFSEDEPTGAARPVLHLRKRPGAPLEREPEPSAPAPLC